MFKIFGDFFGPKKDCDSLKDEMIAHLEKKYGEKFLPIFLEPSGFQIDYDELQFYKEGTDPETDKAHIAKFNRDGKVKYIDNYFGLIIREEYENIIKGVVEKIFGECKVYATFDADSFSDNLKRGNTYEDAIRNGEFINSLIYIYIDNKANNILLKEKEEELTNLLKKVKIKGYYTIYSMKSGHLEKITRKNHLDYVEEFTPQFDEVCYETIGKRISDNSTELEKK